MTVGKSIGTMTTCANWWRTIVAASLVANTAPLLAGSAKLPEPENRKVRIVLVGDSTVTDNAGWGLGFKRCLTDRAECINTAAGGRSSKSFISEGRWTNALALKGDYYLIQFGHNDEPGKGPERETDPSTTYREFMARYVDEARAISAKPILVTSLVRRQFDKSDNHKINSSLTPYVGAVKELAAEKNVPLVDLHARSKELCEQWGKEKCYEFSPLKGTNEFDGTHLNATGSLIFARLVVEELVRVAPELKPCFRDEPSADSTSASARVFDVRQFGAKGDGKTLDTVAIQKALDECGKAGGGVVQFTPGTYLSKPISLRSKTTLLLDEGAKLQATGEQAAFLKSGTNWLAAKSGSDFIPFIKGSKLTDVTITGKGIIDGAGENWWGPAEEARRKTPGYTLPRPNLIVLTGCKNLRVENVTIQNSPKFHFVPTDCDGVIVSNVTVLAPPRAPNTDAIDPSISRNVLITHCRIDVGDDNVAIKSGRKVAGREFACENITVTDCTFLHGHGMSSGSETFGGVRNVTVRNCTFEGTENGIRIKSQRGKGGMVENIRYSDITMNNVDPAITLTCQYGGTSAKDPVQRSAPKEVTAQPVTETTPIYRNIRISNLTATCQRSAGIIAGLHESPVSDVVLENVRISAAATGLTIQNAKGVQLKNVQVTPGEGPPFIVENAQVKGLKGAM